jgi:hypothetical protein
LVSANSDFVSSAIADRYERSFSVSPVIAEWCIVYLIAVLLYRAFVLKSSDGLDLEFAAINRILLTSDFDLSLGKTDVLTISKRLEAMSAHFVDGIRVVRSFDALFDATSVSEYVAGFSCFPRLRRKFSSHDQFCDVIAGVGRDHGLKLNPSVLFGGSIPSWDELYPNDFRIRVNVSGDINTLEQDLVRLGELGIL